MQLMLTKILCSRMLLIDLWVDPMRHIARLHIIWISKYNFVKAHWASKTPRLDTNAPSLYIAWDPSSVDMNEDMEFRGRNPDYTSSFLEGYRALAKKVNEDKNSMLSSPHSTINVRLT